VLVLRAAAPAGAEEVPLRLVPKAVRDAVAARFPAARMIGADRDRDAGGVVYEVAIRDAGRNIDVSVSPEGVVVLIKREIPPAELPASIVEILAGAYPKATYEAVEAVTTVTGGQETLAYYEVDLVTVHRRLVEVRVSTDGTILKGGRPDRGPMR
jgi:hypothetical protein